MPKSKRAKVVSLTKVAKRTKEEKGELITQIQENVEKWQYCWLFEVGNMRNAHLKTVRKLWKDSGRLVFARSTVMAKALGTTPESEHRPGVSKLARQLKGQVGLFFTNSPPSEVTEWFADFQQPDFARAGNTAPRTVVLPAGPVMQRHSDPPEPFPHNEEPQLRKLGLTTYMNRGVPSLHAPHKICEAGHKLTAEQAQLLKLIGEKMVTFRVGLLARWDAETGEVTQIDGPRIADAQVEAEGAEASGDEAMSD